MRGLLFAAFVLTSTACGSEPTSATAQADGAASTTPHALRPLRGLRQTARWPVLATAVAFAHDPRRWVAATDRELVEYDGAREVRRMAGGVSGRDARLVALPGGRWQTGPAILDGDGRVVWSGYAWAQRYGRFGSPKAFAFSADGRVAVVDGADSPSACLCDRERGTSGGRDGALVRLSFVEGAVRERVLIEHDGREFHVAASATAIAAVDGPRLSVWPAHGDGPAVEVQVGTPALHDLRWAGDRYLVGTRYVDIDRTDVVVLDRDAGWSAAWTWPVAGNVRDLAVRPGHGELAIAFDRYRATDRVWLDERRVAVFALDGTRRAQVDLAGHPSSLAWSPRGDALLVATVGSRDDERAVHRFAAR